MDQTGLAQKGGPVMSDLRISLGELEQANHLVEGDCDLYLACDPLTAAQPKNLAVCDPQRTVAVVSAAFTPTGRMVIDPGVSAPDGAMLVRRITRRTRGDRTVAFDAHGTCQRLFGTDQAANLMLVGAAYQAGALPLTPASIERAIEINGAAVEMNVQAFRRGRQLVADPDALALAVEAVTPAEPGAMLRDRARAIAEVVSAPQGGRLQELVLRRVDELIGYQDARYATRYAERIAAVRAAERRVPGDRTELSEAAAIGLHKLMAYKDEYEVARLHLDPGFRAQLTRAFGPGADVSFKLQPPALKALGMKRKIGVPGRLGRLLFRALVPLRRLRHTALDPFGRDEVRKTERALIAEYEALLAEIYDAVDETNYDVAVQLASLPDVVRGYDEVKLGNVERYRSELEALRPRLHEPSREAAERLRVVS
jgi:indolepyruvate ferredoxin oxidoreductase